MWRFLAKVIAGISPDSIEGLDPEINRLRAYNQELREEHDYLVGENERVQRLLRQYQNREDVRTNRRSMPGTFEMTVPPVRHIRSHVAESAIAESRMLRTGPSRPRTFTGPEAEDL